MPRGAGAPPAPAMDASVEVAGGGGDASSSASSCSSAASSEDDELDPLLEVPLRRCTICCALCQLASGLLATLALAVLLPVGALGVALGGGGGGGAGCGDLQPVAGSASAAGAPPCAAAPQVYSTLLAVALTLPLACAGCLCQRHARCPRRAPRADPGRSVGALAERLQLFYQKPRSGRLAPPRAEGPLAVAEVACRVARQELPWNTRIWPAAPDPECAGSPPAAGEEEASLLDVSLALESEAEAEARGRADALPAQGGGEGGEGGASQLLHQVVDLHRLPPRRWPPTTALSPAQREAADGVAAELVTALFPSTAVSWSVVLQVYDWSGGEQPIFAKINSVLGHFIGIYHTGIVVGTQEWGYGKTLDERTGVYLTPVGAVIDLFGHRLRTTVALGTVVLSAEELRAMRTSIEEEWGGVDYHVLYHNCNHFTEGVVRHLNRLQSAKAQGQTPPVGRVPSWVNRLAGLISLILAVALAVQRCVSAAHLLLPARCGGRKYRQHRLLRKTSANEAARTSSATSAAGAEDPGGAEHLARPRADADAGTFIPTPIKLHAPKLSPLQLELQEMKMSALRRRAEQSDATEAEIESAEDSNSPRARMIALIVAAESKASEGPPEPSQEPEPEPEPAPSPELELSVLDESTEVP